ncbi:glycosyltransferase family 4 protein [candidate division WWE3 bacterium]|nr:glycosyltransferase family 4 protein [candidate division WWE3 bacterium]
MKIGIDARFYGEAGPGRYTKSIVQHLEKVDTLNNYIIFLNKNGFNLYTPENPRFKKVLADFPWYSFSEQTTFLITVLKHNLDLYYVPHFNIPILYPKKIVTAIPDMTMHTHSTHASSTLPSWYFLIKKIVYKMVFWWAVFRSYRVIVPSNIVLEEFKQYIKGIPANKYVLAYEGVDPDFYVKHPNPGEVLTKYGITRNFILHVGSMYTHKNIVGLIEMYKLLKLNYGYKGQFVMVCKRDEFSRQIKEKIKTEGLSEDIILPAYVPRDLPINQKIVVSDLEITALRQLADVYVFAAFTEGFSLTALEGMVHGLPAVVSDIPCHREVYGDSALYFNPHDTDDMASKTNTLLTNINMQEEYKKRGFEQVKKYDWLKTAQITLDVFNQKI